MTPRLMQGLFGSALAVTVAAMSVACGGGNAQSKVCRGADTAVEGAKTGVQTGVEGAKTVGKATAGLVTGGTEGAKREWKEGSRDTKHKAREGGQDTKRAAHGADCN